MHATIGGLVGAVNYGVANLFVSSLRQSSLLAPLTSASAALTAGNNTSAKSYLATFVTAVRGTSSTQLNPAYGALLINWAQDLINRL